MGINFFFDENKIISLYTRLLKYVLYTVRMKINHKQLFHECLFCLSAPRMWL